MREHLAPFLILSALAYASLVPFYYLRPLYLGTDLPPLSAARYLPLGIAAFLLLRLGGQLWRSKRLVHTPAGGYLLVVVAVGLASVATAAYPAVSLAKWAYYSLTGVVLCFLLVQYLADPETIFGFVRAIGALFALTTVYTFLSWVLGQDCLWEDLHRQHNPYYIKAAYRAAAPFGNPVSTGAYLLLAAPFLFWLCRHSRAAWSRVTYGVVGVLSLYMVLMTQSRGAWLALAAVLVSVAIRPVVKRQRRTTGPRVAALVVLFLVGLPVSAALVGESGVASWLATQAASVSDRARRLSPEAFLHAERFRIAQYRTTANVLRAHPALGVGLGSFTRVFDTYRDASTPPAVEFPARTTENMYLMFAVETGLVGLGCALALIGAVGRCCLRLHQSLPAGMERDLVLAAMAAIGGVLLNMLTWDALNDPTIRMVFWCIVGVALALERTTRDRPADVFGGRARVATAATGA